MMNFEEWLGIMIENIASIRRRDATEIYGLVNLLDAKLAYMDGVDPYNSNNIDLLGI
jgi:hypothetical protein